MPARRLVDLSQLQQGVGHDLGHRVVAAHLLEQVRVLLAAAALEQLARRGDRRPRRPVRPRCLTIAARRSAIRRSARIARWPSSELTVRPRSRLVGQQPARGSRPRPPGGPPRAGPRPGAAAPGGGRRRTARSSRPSPGWPRPRSSLRSRRASPARLMSSRNWWSRAASASGTPSIVSAGLEVRRRLLVRLQRELVLAHRLGGPRQPVVGGGLVGVPRDLVAVPLDQAAVLAEDDQGVGLRHDQVAVAGHQVAAGRVVDSMQLDRRLGPEAGSPGRGPRSRPGRPVDPARRPAGPRP